MKQQNCQLMKTKQMPHSVPNQQTISCYKNVQESTKYIGHWIIHIELQDQSKRASSSRYLRSILGRVVTESRQREIFSCTVGSLLSSDRPQPRNKSELQKSLSSLVMVKKNQTTLTLSNHTVDGNNIRNISQDITRKVKKERMIPILKPYFWDTDNDSSSTWSL